MAERNGHKNVVRQGDEYVCYACGKRWDDTDERNGEMPQCNVEYRISEVRPYKGPSYADRKAERTARRRR